MNGLQCERLLWFANKKKLPKPSLSDEHKFSQGHDFEEYVKELFTGSVDLNGLEFKENLDKTKYYVEKNKTIFEAGFMIDGLFVRSDLIKPTSRGWHLYEIKSTTEVKPQHITDLAFQKYVLEKNGLKVSNCFVVFIDKEYVKKGKINPKKLVLMQEVTDEVEKEHVSEKQIEEFKEIMKLKSFDEIPISQDCNKPYECPLKKDCWGTLPENNVLHLTNWRVYWPLFHDGVIDLKDVDAETEKLNHRDITILNSLKENPQVNKEKIKEFLGKLNYPLYHFDFETFDTAIPIFDNSRPYQKIPFQYSLHIEQKNGEVEHKEFLSDSSGDPRPALLKQLKKDLAGSGDIIVYNKSFEISVLRKLTDDFPKEKKWIYECLGRIVDLAEPFQKFYYYNKKQKGSYSIKKVLPALTKISYEGMGINNGGDASMMYFYSHIKPRLKGKEKIRKHLLEYCCLDTEAMIHIKNKLGEVIK